MIVWSFMTLPAGQQVNITTRSPKVPFSKDVYGSIGHPSLASCLRVDVHSLWSIAVSQEPVKHLTHSSAWAKNYSIIFKTITAAPFCGHFPERNNAGSHWLSDCYCQHLPCPAFLLLFVSIVCCCRQDIEDKLIKFPSGYYFSNH